MTKIQEMLFQHQDLKYKEFHAKLMPTINPESKRQLLHQNDESLVFCHRPRKTIRQCPQNSSNKPPRPMDSQQNNPKSNRKL